MRVAAGATPARARASDAAAALERRLQLRDPRAGPEVDIIVPLVGSGACTVVGSGLDDRPKRGGQSGRQLSAVGKVGFPAQLGEEGAPFANLDERTKATSTEGWFQGQRKPEHHLQVNLTVSRNANVSRLDGFPKAVASTE